MTYLESQVRKKKPKSKAYATKTTQDTRKVKYVVNRVQGRTVRHEHTAVNVMGVQESVNEDEIKIREDNHNKQDEDKDTKCEKGGKKCTKLTRSQQTQIQ